MTLDELLKAKNIVQELWTTKYAGVPIVPSVVVENRGGASLSKPKNVYINKL